MDYSFYTAHSLKNFSRPFFGLDIREDGIRYVRLSPRKKGFEISSFGEKNIPAGVFKEGRIADPKSLVDILKSLKRKENIRYAKCSIPENGLYVFEMYIPKSGRKESYRVIEQKLSELIAHPPEDLVFDYSVAGSNEFSNKVHVAVLARSVLESYLAVFKQSGIVPIGFEFRAAAAARAMIPLADRTLCMIAGLDGREIKISITDGENILSDYHASFKKPLNDFSSVKEEINAQYVAWQSEKDLLTGKKNPVGKIILYGKEAQADGILEYLSSGLKIKTEHANVWTNVNSFDEYVPPITFNDSLDYATAIGLALKIKK